LVLVSKPKLKALKLKSFPIEKELMTSKGEQLPIIADMNPIT